MILVGDVHMVLMTSLGDGGVSMGSGISFNLCSAFGERKKTRFTRKVFSIQIAFVGITHKYTVLYHRC